MDISSRIRFGVKKAVGEIDWEAIYHSMLPRVFQYFAYRVGNRQVAEDLTASTFERAWRKRKKYRNDLGKFSHWIFGIARNVAREHFRQAQSDHELDEKSERLAAKHPEGQVNLKEDYERLAVLLAKLPNRERELIALKYGAEMTNRAIARVSGLSESNIGTILHRVVSRLRQEWEKDNE